VEGAALVPDGSEMRERPTVILLHGGPGSFDHTYFKPDFGRLAEVAQVVYLDLPGHGRSYWGDPANWSFEACADDVRDFADALGIARPIVYGHSLGGQVAMLYAARNPGHPSRLVLQSTNGRFDLDRVVDGFRRLGGDEVGETVRRVYSGDSSSVTADEWAQCWAVFGGWVPGREELTRTTVNRELNAPGLALLGGFDVLDRLGTIQCPTLVCVGEDDPIMPVAAAEELVEALPDGVVQLGVLEGAGHFPWRDAPDRYWPLLIDFIRAFESAAE
jgi:proline iminopeptidase